jgi:glycerol-1-phosphate dehydrogenase [NAD(P)+]
LQQIWPELSLKLKAQLLPAEQLQAMLAAAGAASDPIEIGISRKRLEAARNSAHTIRQRYTILDLRYELGVGL